MIPAPQPYDMTVHDRVLVRGLMKIGCSLKHIADVLKVTAHELDLALWNSLGRRT